MHDKNCWLNVHDVILLRREVKPVVEQGELGVGGGDLIGASGQEPPDHGPPRDNVGTEQFVGRVNDADDEAYEVAPQRLGLGGGEVLLLEPVLITLMRSKPYLKRGGVIFATNQRLSVMHLVLYLHAW